ncbi:MAG TPA: tetratricopeptide repeat protein [Terracidiphilus sp.]|nr:tetratricopeptide repeat protein [Terracidiphilus sp.]
MDRIISARWAFAIALFWAVPSLAQQSPDSLAEARTLLNDGKLAESEAALRKDLVQSPASPEVHFLLGYVLFREKKAKESLAEFTAGAKYRRPVADELKVVASDYVLLGDFGDADRWFTEVVAEKPDEAEAWYLLGRTKFNENSFEEAKSDFERALTLHPKYVEAENNIGLSWKELNNPAKAQSAFQTAIEWQGDAPADEQPFLNLGTLLSGEGEIDKAIPYLTKAAMLAPNNPRIHEELGQAYLLQQDLRKAQAELEKAVALAPDISALHFKLGQIYRKEGLHDRAQHEFDICSRLNSTHSSPATPNPLTLGGPPSH